MEHRHGYNGTEKPVGEGQMRRIGAYDRHVRTGQAGRQIGGVAGVDLEGGKPVNAMAQLVCREPGSRSEFESVLSKLALA